jgi:DNA (cytosine-5)-methyltransferase 1
MYTYIDLFAGCGGLSDGFEKNGLYRGIAHVEWDTVAAKTLAKRLTKKWNIPESENRVLRFDIQKTDELIRGWSDKEYGESNGLKSCLGDLKRIDVLIGGPPCQAYSIAGRIRDEHSMHNDYRNYLFESYIKIMNWCKPDIFIFENVLGILSAAPGGIPIVNRIHEAFSKAGYVTLDNFKDAVFNFSEFGLPQKRTRVIIIGLKKTTYKSFGDIQEIIKSFYSEFKKNHKVNKIVSAKMALDGLSKFYPIKPTLFRGKKLSHGPIDNKFLNHVPRFHNERDIDTFRILTEDLSSGEGKYFSAQALKDLYTLRTGKKSSVHKYHVIRPDIASNTIPAHLFKDGLRHIHWDKDQSRSITVREAARLQGFEDDFEFLGNMGDQYKMIGNAVPPLFSNLLAKELINLLKIRSGHNY